MNWFLLLLILKLFTHIWAAPIDLLEVKDDIQVEQNISNSFIQNNLNGTIDQANTLFKTAEDELNSTSLQLNENLNDNAQKISTDLHNFTAEGENVVETNFEKETTEKISEVTTTTEVNGDESGAISNSVTIIPHEEIEHEEISQTTQSPLEISTDVGDFSSESVMPANAESRNNADIILTEPAVTEFVSNVVKTSTEVETAKDNIGTPANEESLIEPMEISENKTDESTENISTTLNEFETEKVDTDNEKNLEHTTQASNPEATTTPNTPTIVKILNENVEQIYNLSEKLVENSLSKVVEDTNNSEQSAILVSNQESTTVNDLGESFTPTTEEISSTPIEINNNVDKQSAMEVTTHHYPEVSSTETPALKETVDSFINQVTDIGSSIGKEAEELRFDASMIHAATENFINPESPVVMQENMTESQKPLVAEQEDNSEKAPTFKEAVDSFIEEVVEIGSKLGLIPEEKPVKEIPTTTEPLSELINIATTPAPEMKETAESNDSSTDSPVLEMEDKTEEIIIATTPSLEILAENLNNHSDSVQNSENSNLGRSVETLIEAASEIGNNFSKTFSNLFTTNENEPETNKLNESLMEKTSSAEQSNSENSEISSTQVPIVTFQGDFPKYSIINHENIEVPSTTPAEESTETLDEHQENKEDIPKESENITQQAVQQTPEDIKPKEEEQFGKYESLSYPAEEITKTSEDLSENKEDIKQENENFTKQILPQTPEDIKPTEEEQSAKYGEYIPVAVITIPEDEGDSTKQNEHSEQPILIGETNETGSEPEPQASQGEESIVKNEQLENANSEQPTQTNEENESEKTSESPNQDVIHKTEEYITLAPTSQETTTTNSPVVIVEETTNALNKFENTLKTLIEQEKLKHEERHATALETNQQETTTLAPSTKSSTAHQEEPTTTTTTTTQSLEETTMLPKKFEEELQMAVKALEETTHHHFEEFQNNLKEAFKKFTVWGAEHERPETTTSATTTIFKTELNEATTTETETTQQSLSEHPTTMMPEVDNNQDKTDVVLEETLKTEEPHRIGVINQNFVDKFADNYVESPVATSTETPMVKEQSSPSSEMPESVIEMEQTTETPMDLTTILPVEDEIKSVPQEQKDVKAAESFMEVTSINNDDDLKEVLTPIAENIVKESNAESVETTTEYIAETTATPLLVRVTLQKDFNSVSLVPDNEQNTVAPIQEPTALQPDSEQIKEIHTETTQNTEALEEATTLPTFETSVKEMVTFIEHNDTTTVKQQQENEEEDSVTTMQTQTQEPLTQASFMEEQQQQLESTTEHDAQTQTADASGQTATTTTVRIEDDDTYEQETTETDIHSTTVVEEDEMATTTVEPTAAPVEPEARSLSLPPPKLEYLQNEDGVEVFYGYSIVKHN
ncbi:hypothetical protein FF38_05271 [Lucilia cuprina]|uniref:Zonadhesin n=1 Tax=Lucilia cuprina TaxID=7375 RepID=A0A0L0BZY6_LUCCU|nr:hypothetical protein FF38_05271 [Lucilia cuprina]